jgi:hypothetical protein
MNENEILGVVMADDKGAASVSLIGMDGDRWQYRWMLYLDGTVIATGDDLRSGCYQNPTPLPEMLETLAAFIAAAYEAQQYEDSENRDLFPESAQEWITAYADDLSMLTYSTGDDN